MKSIFQTASWGIQYRVTPEMIQIQSEQPLHIVSSAIVRGGETTAKTIVNRYVPKSYCPADPEREVEEWLDKQRMAKEQTVVLLTAAYVELGSVRVLETEFFRLAVWATAGTGNAARAGRTGPVYLRNQKPGTINLILLIDGKCTSSAMVNSVITATEAKTAALQEIRVTDKNGEIATGTTTDAIVIASTGQRLGNYCHHYAGIASPLGQAIGKEVYEAVREAVMNERRLKGRGV